MAIKRLGNILNSLQKEKLRAHGLEDVLLLEFNEEQLHDPNNSDKGIFHFVALALSDRSPFKNDPNFRSAFRALITEASLNQDRALMLI